MDLRVFMCDLATAHSKDSLFLALSLEHFDAPDLFLLCSARPAPRSANVVSFPSAPRIPMGSGIVVRVAAVELNFPIIASIS
jgi:hypothetical protein